jgi:DNA-binding PadR family transcriptional regulator
MSGDPETQVLFAISNLEPLAYGVTIADEIERRTGRHISLGAIYAAIERFERDGWIKTRQGEATSERGNRPKLYVDLTRRGRNECLKRERAAAEPKQEKTPTTIGDAVETCAYLLFGTFIILVLLANS